MTAQLSSASGLDLGWQEMLAASRIIHAGSGMQLHVSLQGTKANTSMDNVKHNQ